MDVRNGFSGLKTVRFGLKSLFPLDSRIHSARPGFIVGSRIEMHNQFQRSCRLHVEAGSCFSLSACTYTVVTYALTRTFHGKSFSFLQLFVHVFRQLVYLRQHFVLANSGEEV